MAGQNAFLRNKSGKSPLASWPRLSFAAFALAVFAPAVFVLGSQSAAFAQTNARASIEGRQAHPDRAITDCFL